MKKQAIFFDLDGTLLPMEQERFTNGYFKFLAAKVAPLGYDAATLVPALWKGVGAMVQNDGAVTNDQRFWSVFCAQLNRDARRDEPVFDEFSRTEFHQAKQLTGPNPLAPALVAAAREKADRVILATNPIFPPSAQRSRLSWVGLTPEDFDWVTDYENSRYCKPNPAYYRELLTRFGLDAQQCVMIGNDMEEDMQPAAALGMERFLITDCLINPQQRPLDMPHGSVADALAWVKELR